MTYLLKHIRKHRLVIPVLCFFLFAGLGFRAEAQCSICTKTAQQLGEKPAKALNKGIVYLMMTPLTIFGVIGFRWWRSNHLTEANPNND